ncbi:MAG: sugar phosphate isomerase/epimerase [Pedosphaera sp.]|nr:sugar phosphate isomerase/epimerase [Pedosphaera sp.]
MNRRHFIQLTATAATAATTTTAPTLFAADKKDRAIKKAIMWGTVGVKGNVLEKMKLVKAAGFTGVEPNGGMNREDVVAALKETGLLAASVCCHTHWARPLSAAEEPTRKVGYDGLVLSMEDAKAYGATSVLLVPGVVTDKVNYDDCFKRCVAEIKKAAKVAADLGVKIAIENVWNDFVTKPQQAVDLLDAINSEWVGWHFDIGNVGRYSPAEEWIPVLGKRILKLHIKEFDTRKMTPANPGAGFGAKFLEGNNNWPAIMAALDKAGYTGWGIAEQGGGGSPEGLKDLSDRMTKIFAS